ncbi:MAG: DMT family transporter [Alphaproteobacteria bacterium]|uniref:EamA family transporter n=1 Tax=Brevundimonas sp. TaxID=1871086 RepID=UPI001D3D6FFD|nr:DMT family transporter [Alphaproteobacteria bacterium]MBU1520610.1 DMT family transporter [Alphaproteobacteria bacterium]MBU2031833.1 DMT family transporter [Alphaproteobacteria bacterium]MBU2166050.1 DMT family transporter [Alphaproteobacteria bacterium]MBU2229802.1 DMT family transporter [Alphaproteobacteria bacterium]
MTSVALKQHLTSPLAMRLIPYLALFAGMVTLAGGTSFAKTLFPLIGAQGTSAYRVGISAVLLVAVFRPWRFRLSRADLGAIALYGVVLGAMNLSFYMSLRTIPLGLAIAIEFMGPLSLALIHSRKPIHFVCVGFAVLGLSLLLPLKAGTGALDPVGMALAAFAGLCWALYIVFGKRLSHIHAGQSVALGMSVAAMVVVPFGVAHAGAALLNPAIILAGVAVAIFSSALPYSLEMVALRGIPKRTFGVVLSAEPAVGALAGLIVLHEHLTGQQWLAIAAIVVASVGAIATTREERVRLEPA